VCWLLKEKISFKLPYSTKVICGDTTLQQPLLVMLPTASNF